MATFPYQDFRKLATELIGVVFGEQTATLARPGNPDPAAPWRGGNTASPETIENLAVVFTGISQRDRGTLNQVLQTDQIAWLAGEGLPSRITAEWYLLDDAGVRYEIVDVANRIQPGRDVIAYALQVRS